MTLAEQEYIYLQFGIEPYNSMCSPLRTESRPSFSTYLSNDKMCWKDFGTGDSGDVYSFVMTYYDCDFKSAAAKIKEMLAGADASIVDRAATPKPTLNMDVTTFDYYKKFEAAYWALRDIDVDTLMADNVFPLKMLRKDKEFKATSSSTNPKFVYYLNEERTAWKIYSPLDKDFKWISYNTHLVPYESPPEGKHKDLIIFSSKKDRLVFKALGLPYDTTSLISEGNFAKFIKELPNLKYEHIYALLDFDDAGESYTNQIEAQSNGRIKGLYLPNNTWNYFASIGVKDIDDIRIKLGAAELNSTINKILV